MTSNEIQLALTPNLPAHPAPWAMGPLGAPVAPAAAEQTPFTKVHRLLRGRYLLATVLALCGAAGGAAAGFLSQKPAYRSDGLIEIDPRIPRSDTMDKVMILVNTYVQSTMAKLKSQRVVEAALRDPRWQAVRPNANPNSREVVAEFTKNLTVALPPRSNNFIQVGWSDDKPDAQKAAPVAVACVLQAYTDLYSSDDAKELQRKIDYWVKEQSRLDNEIQSKRRLIETLAKEHEDDPMVIRFRSEELITVQRALQQSEEMLAMAEKDLQDASAGGTHSYTPEDWARVDETMGKHVQMRNELQLRIDSLEAQLGGQHPVVVRSKDDLKARERAMEVYGQKLSSQFMIRWKPDGTGGVLIARDLGGLRESVIRTRELYARESEKVNQMRFAAAQINTAREEITTATEKLKEAAEQLREFNFQKDFLGPGRIRIISTGDLAAVDKDRRPMFAAAGFVGGAAIPLCFLLLIGLLDSRYRYSDEAGTATSGLTLLGILPNLPDRLSDPEQAAIAAHCVHQIRTMLQINGPEERRVFAVTSASPGDGKTSLTLALGLSYAACGTRTLLIDCDLIGAGLTSRMNVSAAEGVLEAIANRNLLQYVRQTDIADVVLLPVGSAGNLHASTLSPAALRRLIEEAEKHFETILIDTGPILGSIEASLVCAAADAVVLTVARGQQRPMVEKSLGHLTAIGARLAGVVFNRAQASDFERSISGVSMRSVGVHGPRGPAGANGARFGPVARAVATTVHPTDGNGMNGHG